MSHVNRFIAQLKWIIWWQITARLMKIWLRPRRAAGLVALGEESGTWVVPETALKPGDIAYLGGAGDNISFDLELWRRGLIVRTFDPTPIAIDYVERLAPKDDRFTLVPVGWWGEPTELPFFTGFRPSDVSFSATNMFDGDRSPALQVDTIAGCMRALGDDHVDLVKIDIEGAEKIVLKAMLAEGPFPATLCVEFDMPLSGVINSIRSLKSAGYALLAIDGWNYTYQRSSA